MESNTSDLETRESIVIDESLLSLVPEQFRSGVLSGIFLIEPEDVWYSPNKPVIVRKAGHRIVAGKYKQSGDIGRIAKQTSYKRTTSYC